MAFIFLPTTILSLYFIFLDTKNLAAYVGFFKDAKVGDLIFTWRI